MFRSFIDVVCFVYSLTIYFIRFSSVDIQILSTRTNTQDSTLRTISKEDTLQLTPRETPSDFFFIRYLFLA